jgi:acyl-CoA synthetase (AMP-forming)/AMP-acid ligase II
MNLVERLSRQAAASPERPAIVETRRGRDRTITFGELERRIAETAAAFRCLGLKPGDHAVFLEGIGIDLYAALLGLLRAGGVAVFVDFSAGWRGLREAARLVKPSAVVAGLAGQAAALLVPELLGCRLRIAPGSGFRLPIFRSLGGSACDGHSQAVQPCRETDPALLTFTSGTTGPPKAAMRSHGFLLAQHRVLESSIRLEAGEVDLATLPVFVLANLASGVTTLLPDADISRPGRIDPAPVWRQLRKHRPVRAAASPAFFERLADSASEAPSTTDSLRKIYTGGAPVFPRTLLRLREVFPNSDPEVVYGSTEAEPISHVKLSAMGPGDFRRMREGAGLLVGRPVPEIQLAILEDQVGNSLGRLTAEQFEAKRCATGVAGEIVVTGDHVLKHYWQGCGEEETKFEVDGLRWHRTGDAGYLDPNGRLWLLGRCKARLEDSHGRCYPLSVECTVSFFPTIRRSALVAWQGQRILLFEPSSEPPPHFARQVIEELAWAKIGRAIPINKVPVDNRHQAKIDYPRLRKLLEKLTVADE